MDTRGCSVAILAADGFSAADVAVAMRAIRQAGARSVVVATHLGVLDGDNGSQLPIDVRLVKTEPSSFDGIFVPGGRSCVDNLTRELGAVQFIARARGHCRAIAAAGAGVELLLLASRYPMSIGDEWTAGDIEGRRGSGKLIFNQVGETSADIVGRLIEAMSLRGSRAPEPIGFPRQLSTIAVEGPST